MLALLVAIPLMGMAAAQAPPGDDILLVNAGREFVERKKEGGFIARPVYDRQIDALYYAIRDADTGDWLTPLYRVLGGEKRLSEGWEYSWEYPALHHLGQNLEPFPLSSRSKYRGVYRLDLCSLACPTDGSGGRVQELPGSNPRLSRNQSQVDRPLP